MDWRCSVPWQFTIHNYFMSCLCFNHVASLWYIIFCSGTPVERCCFCSGRHLVKWYNLNNVSDDMPLSVWYLWLNFLWSGFLHVKSFKRNHLLVTVTNNNVCVGLGRTLCYKDDPCQFNENKLGYSKSVFLSITYKRRLSADFMGTYTLF